MDEQQSWEFAAICYEGTEVDVAGINPWKLPWRRLHDDPVLLPHPRYPSQLDEYWIYQVDVGDKQLTFAAGELSMNVWGFYVPNKPVP